jgi:hypothetical protein
MLTLLTRFNGKKACLSEAVRNCLKGRNKAGDEAAIRGVEHNRGM